MKTGFALGILLTVTTLAGAQAARVDGFRGTLINVAGEAGRDISADVIRWSTDAERDKVTAAAAKGDTALLDVLKGMPTLGYVWTGESVGYQIRYAFKAALPNDSERIVLATDRPLGSFQLSPWKPAPPATATAYQFTVLEMRLTKNAGEAKMSMTTKIAPDTAAKTVALDDYAAAPVMIKNVRRF